MSRLIIRLIDKLSVQHVDSLLINQIKVSAANLSMQNDGHFLVVILVEYVDLVHDINLFTISSYLDIYPIYMYTHGCMYLNMFYASVYL